MRGGGARCKRRSAVVPRSLDRGTPPINGEDQHLDGQRQPHPNVVVCLEVVPFGVDYPQVPRLGAALARSRFAALLYWSPAMRIFASSLGDVEGIAQTWR